MTIEMKPGPAKTTTGAPLPLVAMPQHKLLTVNKNDIPLIRDSLAPGIHYKPLRLDVEGGEYIVLLILEPGTRFPLHYHTGTVDAYTFSGCWYYMEHADEPQTAGSYLFEPAATVHTLTCPASNTENTEILFRVVGANVNFNDDGTFHSILDATLIHHLTGQLAEAQGLGKIPYIEGGSATRV